MVHHQLPHGPQALVSGDALASPAAKVADGAVLSTRLPLHSQSLLHFENTRLPLLT